MAGEQLFSKFVIKGGGKTFTEQSTILIFRQKPIRLIVVNAAVIETYTVKKCTNRSRCAHGIYSLTMILKKNAKYRLFDFIQVKAKAGNTGIGIGLCHRKHLIHYGSESPCRIQNNSLNNFAKVICVFRVTHHEIVDGAVLQTELLRVCLDDFQNVLFLEIILGMQTGKLFVRDRNARAIFCIGFFAAQHPKAQKDAAHINKHAMHIVRLYYTAFDILEKGEIITHRDKEREELLAIRNGKYLREDGSYAPEFFEFVNALEKRFQDDVRKTPLPAKPDFGKIEELLVEINKSYLRRIV